MLVVKVWFRPALVSMRLPRFGFVLQLVLVLASSDLLNVTVLLVDGVDDDDDDEAATAVDEEGSVSVVDTPC